jgi:hypothetical protein
MKDIMSSPSNTQTQSGRTSIPRPQRRTRLPIAITLLTSLAVFSASTPAFAQRVTPAVNNAALLAAVASPAAFAEVASASPFILPATSPAAEESSSTFDAGLPEDPSAHSGDNVITAAGNATPPPDADGPTAPIYAKVIPAGWQSEPLTARDKVILGFRDLYSPLSIASIIFTAGYEHVTNGEPNYGTNSGAFAERVGATAIRQSSEGIFTDTIFAPLLHEDPRYYVEGPEYGFFHRTIYAITRPLVTRTDSGGTTLNGALLLGYASASGLTNAYYPQINRNFHDTASTFGVSIGGAALGFFVHEFKSDVLEKLHLAKLE